MGNEMAQKVIELVLLDSQLIAQAAICEFPFRRL
jgi:hypothetical protein